MRLTPTSTIKKHLKGDAMNMPATQIQDYTLSLNRDFNAPPEKVFQAWTDPRIMARWFGPDGAEVQSAEIDLEVGGEYRLTLKEPDGSVAVLHGAYREIDPPRKLIFTWILDGQACEGSAGLHAETVVTLVFEDQGGGNPPGVDPRLFTHRGIPGRSLHGLDRFAREPRKTVCLRLPK